VLGRVHAVQRLAMILVVFGHGLRSEELSNLNR
jgi:hypothetical protein